MSAGKEPAAWAMKIAAEVYAYGPRAYDSERVRLARKIEAESPCAELLAALSEIATTNASKHGTVPNMLFRAITIASEAIAKHAPKP
jgi:hypothetical protein